MSAQGYRIAFSARRDDTFCGPFAFVRKPAPHFDLRRYSRARKRPVKYTDRQGQKSSYAAAAMRSVVVDYVRERGAKKRGGNDADVTLDTGVAETVMTPGHIEALNDGLLALEQIDTRACRVAEMRYFGGLSEEEIADA